MSSRLEEYLGEVAGRTRALPAPERERQFTELCQHLEALVAARQEMGDDAAEAVRNALSQFGAAEQVAASLTRTYRRRAVRQLLNCPIPAAALAAGALRGARRVSDNRFGAATMAAGALAVALPLMFSLHIPDVWQRIGIRLPHDPPDSQWALYLGSEPALWLLGAAIGLLLRALAPRSARRSVLPGLLITLLGCYVWQGDWRPAPWEHRPLLVLMNTVEMASIYGALAAAAALTLLVLQHRGRRSNGPARDPEVAR